MKKLHQNFSKRTFSCLAVALFFALQSLTAQHRSTGRSAGKSNSPQVSKKVSAPSGIKSSGTKKTGSYSKPNALENTNNRSAGNLNNTNSRSKYDKNFNDGRQYGNKNSGISGNNIDRSRKNTNVNIDNSKNINIHSSRNTAVKRNTIVYARPPYVYGGYRYHSYHPYYFHPYHPYYWGPVWHPWGFFVAALTVTAIVVSVENTQYHYDQGVWYTPSNGGYTAVAAPIGGTVNNIPAGAQTVNTGTVNNYYYGGTYYEKENNNYKVVAPTAGTVVENLPEGGEEVTIGDVKYVKFGETYYQPVQIDGKSKYEVILIEKDI
jgi:hypothetical protein